MDYLSFHLISFSGPVGFFSNSVVELLALRMGLRHLREAFCLNLRSLLMEGGSRCVINWAFSSCKPPWRLLDVEEVTDLARFLDVSFSLVACSANQVADTLALYG